MARIAFSVLDVDYVMEDGKPVVRIWGKTDKGETILALDRGFRPYFFLDVSQKILKDMEDLRNRLSQLKYMEGKEFRLEKEKKKILGEEREFLRLTIQNPADIPKIRHITEDWEGIRRAYEHDISFYRRYMIDKRIFPSCVVEAEGKEERKIMGGSVIDVSELKVSEGERRDFSVMGIDIETAKGQIIMISYFTDKGKKGVITYNWGENVPEGVEMLNGEEEMLKRFFEIVLENDPDMMVTYNGDVFDFHRIKEKSERYKIPVMIGRDGQELVYTKRGRVFSAKVPGRVHVDIYNFIDRILGDSLESEVLTLDMVSREIIGEGKTEVRWDQIRELWKEKKGLKKVADYCLRDSGLAVKLSRRVLPQIYELSSLVGQSLFDVSRMSYSQLVEWLLIKKASEAGETILNRPRYDEIRRRREASPFTGGYVYPPEPGIHHAVSLFDFTSLYPSIIITHNVSPETLDKGTDNDSKENKVPGEGHFFGRENKGFITSVIEDLVKRRTDAKVKMNGHPAGSEEHRDLHNKQYALKIIANASYGYYAYAGSRWYSRICASSIAAWGRYYIQHVIEFAKNRNFRVIYGDTDSLFLERCSKSKARDFVKDINKELPETMELEFVNSYKSGLFVQTKSGTTAKKRYALLDTKGVITVRGFEQVRRDWSRLAKETQEKVLEAILKENDQNKAVNIVEETIEKLNSGKAEMSELVIYTQITRPLEQYDQIGPHVTAARKYVEHGHVVTPGSVIGYIITKGLGSISSRAEPVEYAKNYDPEYYVNHQIIPAAMRILNAVGLSEEDFDKDEPGQKSLDSYMKKSISRKIREKWKKIKE
ncbi:MAG: ribonuclease H-like domain-containing protein [Candidatus Aenigmarchaeota archaeon]|nr:ribonuclease H-like domain-containing protein [Candidatus Aenigmarchaeota archaeon]